MDPSTLSTLISLGNGSKSWKASLPTAIAIIGSSVINAVVSTKNVKRNIQAQKERDERMAELQERYRFEDKQFQRERDLEHKRSQYELEAQRMSFQEHLEMRRLQFQAKMEQRREEFQMALTELQQNFNRELAQFQAQAMRETQILVARENAQLMLENQMVLDALKTFPLNISPMVLLNNRHHSLSSLMRFTVGDSIEINGVNKQKLLLSANPRDVIADVIGYIEHPEALNIFIAPVFVDSKVPFQKMISTRIWEITYQMIESFFTKNYSRDGKTPVMFYPTAWNDKYTSGVHASETLHYFLKDLPCIVLEPKFDGNRFRLAISHWGVGYTSTEHHRTECDFNINTDLFIANAVYERSKNGLEALKVLFDSDALLETEMRNKYIPLEHALEKNMKFFEAFRLNELQDMDEQERQKVLNQMSALGLGNIFTIDNNQDLEPLAQYLSSQIGVILAMLADTHHLLSTGATPRLPELMQDERFFKDIYADKQVRGQLFKNYKSVFAQMREEEMALAEKDMKQLIRINRNLDISDVREQLGISSEIRDKTWQEWVKEYVEIRFNYSNDDFESVWSKFFGDVGNSDRIFLKHIINRIDDEYKKEHLEQKMDSI